MDAPNVTFNILNLSYSVASILKGISGVEGVTLRGPFAKADILVTSWAQFLRLYGGYISNSDFPLLCKRAFDRGAQLRVNRVGHYTDITDITSLDAVKASMNVVKKLTFSAALVASNQFDLTINGTAITPVIYASTSDATMAAIATAIRAITAYVQDAYVVTVAASTTNDRVIVIIPATNTTLTLTSPTVTLGASQATVAETTMASIISNATSPGLLFTVRPKYEGVDYNNLSITISAASNGNSAYFNMAIAHSGDSQLAESYQNLTIPGLPTIVASHYLDAVKTATQLMDFTYLDLSALTGTLRPRNGTYYFNTGSDGTAPAVGDYVGDSSAKNGLYAFDAVDDIMQVCAPELSSTTLHIAGSAYAANRKDLVYFAHLDNANTTKEALIADRVTIGADSYYTALFAGGIKITDPETGLVKEISELGDILGVAAVNDEFGEWFSMAGVNRGLILNALGVVNNFGTTASFADLNILSNRQINMVIQAHGRIYLNGNYSAVLSNSKLSFLSAVRFLIYLQKSLTPTLMRYLQEPADIPTFKAIYREVEPFMNNLITERAIYSYRWMGDQDAKKIEDVQINNTTDLDNGKYKIKLYLKIIPSLQEISVDLVVTATSVNFDNLS